MHIRLVVEVQVEKSGEGTFKSRDDIINELKEQLADPGSIDVDGANYEVTSFDVDELPEGHCDPAIRGAVERLLSDLASDLTMEQLAKRTRTVRRLLGMKPI